MATVTAHNITGKVEDEFGNPAGGRTVRVYDRETGGLYTTGITSGAGVFQFAVDGSKEYTVMCMPLDGEDMSNAKVFDRIKPVLYKTATANNDIGTPGSAGFGVGVCPENVPDMIPMDGFDDPYHSNYGNYRHTLDDSIMVWIPAFYYKWGDDTNGIAFNNVFVKNYSLYENEAAANADGYALHRAFIDGGEIKKGFFIDKYLNCKHPTLMVASSHYKALPLVGSTATFNTFGVSNRSEAFIDIALLRGEGFHIAPLFMFNALSILSRAHAKYSSSTEYCAWYNQSYNFPKGNTNNGAAWHDNFIQFIKYYGYNYSFTGASNYEERCTHNGQACGITDISGNLQNICIGICRQDFPGFGQQWCTISESTSIKNLCSSDAQSGKTQLWLRENWDKITGDTLINGLPNSFHIKDNDGVNKVFTSSVDRNSNSYKLDNIGIPASASAVATTSSASSGFDFNGTVINFAAQILNAYGGNYSSSYSMRGTFGYSYVQWNSGASVSGLRSARYI